LASGVGTKDLDHKGHEGHKGFGFKGLRRWWGARAVCLRRGHEGFEPRRHRGHGGD